jgi:hypothetical protein
MLEIRALGKSLLPRKSTPFDDMYVSSLESLARSVITPGQKLVKLLVKEHIQPKKELLRMQIKAR